MDTLNKNINKLIQKTLEMEDESVKALHQDGIYSHSQQMNLEVLEASQDFSSADKIVNRQKIRHTATRIKSRNFLSNISYTDIRKSDFYNENFILDVYVLLVKNLNPFSLSRKVTDKTKHEIVYILWRECILQNFIDISAKKKILFISTVEMLVILVCSR